MDVIEDEKRGLTARPDRWIRLCKGHSGLPRPPRPAGCKCTGTMNSVLSSLPGTFRDVVCGRQKKKGSKAKHCSDAKGGVKLNNVLRPAIDDAVFSPQRNVDEPTNTGRSLSGGMGIVNQGLWDLI